MTNEIETLPTAEEAEAMLAALDLYMERNLEVAEDTAKAPTAFAAYWAGSAAAQGKRDVAKGRSKVIRA